MEATMSLSEDKLTIRDSMKEAEDINKIKTACAAAGLDDTATAQLIGKYGPYAEAIVKRNTAQAGENAGGFPNITYFLNNDLQATEVGKLLNIKPTEYEAKKQEWFITHPSAKIMESSAHDTMNARQARLENQILAENNQNNWPPSDEDYNQYITPLLAQFEGVRGRAYSYSGQYLIGFGSAYLTDKDGKQVKVTAKDKIQSSEQLAETVKNHVDKAILKDMEKRFPVDKMSKQEIAAVISIYWQHGSAVFDPPKGAKDKRAHIPNFSKNYTLYKETGDKKYLDAAVKDLRNIKYNTTNATKLASFRRRRDFEARLLTGEITLGTQQGELDLNTIPLSAMNSIGNTCVMDTVVLQNKLIDFTGGKNLADSISYELKKKEQKKSKETNVSTARKVTQAKSR
jgi:GH24 family phage-related lysozyme (muramidase)